MMKKSFSSKILKLTTSVLSGILCIGCLISNNAGATLSKNIGEYKQKIVKRRHRCRAPRRIAFRSLRHILDGRIKRDGYLRYVTGGHLYEYEDKDQEYLKDKRVDDFVRIYLANKTYFAEILSRTDVEEMVRRALKYLEDIRVDAGTYHFNVVTSNNIAIGSHNEEILRVNLKRDDYGKLYCASAYPVGINPHFVETYLDMSDFI